jgi:hypothetical protein
MTDQPILTRIWVLFLLLVGGCATNSTSATAARETDPDCSFRSPTTCWTVSGRFPPRRVEPAAAPVEKQPPPVLASGEDSVRGAPR